jgi:phosphoserine phosphatase
VNRYLKQIGILAAMLFSIVSFGCAKQDPLPSWNDTAAKRAIIEFVDKAADPSSDGYIPEADRIATFDNDGTLWPEQPYVQELFVFERLHEMAKRDPSLRQRQPFKAALEGDMAYLHEQGEKALMELLALTHAGMTQDEFEPMAKAFFATGKYPTLSNAAIVDLAYQPMIEVMNLLRSNGFDVYICSGGGVDFMRAVTDRIYDIPMEKVIGSTLVYEQRDINGRSVLWREPKVAHINDKAGKPVGIHQRIGRRPALAGGNVRSGGDIQMLRYSQDREGPSLQLLVNHDDAVREFAYSEKEGESLKAAQTNGWTVISIKDDWKHIFSVPVKPTKAEWWRQP